MTDIIERLRYWRMECMGVRDADTLMLEAENEIEKLRRRAERAEELLREAMDNNNCGCDDCQITRFRVEAHFKEVAP